MAKLKLRTYKAEHAGIKRSKLKKKSAQETASNKSEVIQTLGGGIQPVIHDGRIKWKRVPKEPIPELSDINTHVGQKAANARKHATKISTHATEGQPHRNR